MQLLSERFWQTSNRKKTPKGIKVINKMQPKTTIEAGDLILLSRRCDQMTPVPAVICFSAKGLGGSEIDHLGLVVFNPETQKLCLMEANMNGVTVYPLLDRLAKTSASKIVLRKLHKLSSDAQQSPITTKSSWNIYLEYANAKYNSSFVEMIDGLIASHTSAVTNDGSTMECYKQKEYELQLINHFLQKRSANSKILTHYLQLAQLSCQKDLIALENQIRSFPSVAKAPTSSVFCSQMIAEILLRYNVISSNRKPHHFIPADFSSKASTNSLTTSADFAYSPDYCLKQGSKSPSFQLKEANGVIHVSLAPVSELFLHSGDVISGDILTQFTSQEGQDQAISFTFSGKIAIVMSDYHSIILSSTDNSQEVDLGALIQQLKSANKQFYLLARSHVQIKLTNKTRSLASATAGNKLVSVCNLEQLEMDTLINLAYNQAVEKEYQQLSLQHLHSNKVDKLVYSLQPNAHVHLASSISQKILKEIFEQPLDNSYSQSIETWRDYLHRSRREYFRLLCYSEYAHHLQDQRLLDNVIHNSKRRLLVMSPSNTQDGQNRKITNENNMLPIAIMCGALKISQRLIRF